MSGQHVRYDQMGKFDHWGPTIPYGTSPGADNLRTGALIRIAGALERIATRMADVAVGVNTSDAQKFALWQERRKEDEEREARNARYHAAVLHAAELFADIPSERGAKHFIIRRWGVCVGVDGKAIDPLAENASAELSLPPAKRYAYEEWRSAKIAANAGDVP